MLAYLEPASATFLGWLVLDEALGIGTLLGGILVVAGGLLVLGAPGVEEPTLDRGPGAAGRAGLRREARMGDVPG